MSSSKNYFLIKTFPLMICQDLYREGFDKTFVAIFWTVVIYIDNVYNLLHHWRTCYCMSVINPWLAAHTPYSKSILLYFYAIHQLRIRLDYTRFFVHALRSRQFCDTLISNSNEVSSSNPTPIEDFMITSEFK